MPKGHFVITDVSGYTEFLTQSELEHAHEILQSLFDAQLANICPPFVISGFRGDAIFLYIPETSFVQPQSVVEAMENLYTSFASTREQMQYQTTCRCRACQGMASLDLKIVAHFGSYVIQKMGEREELLGVDVIVPHRMLKNHVIKKIGIRTYALFSEESRQALHLDEFCAPLYDHVETYENIGEMKMVVYDISAAWQREKEARRTVVQPDEAWVKYEVDVAAPPSTVWDYLTMPDLKVEMLGLDFMKRIDDLGGRVGSRTKYHCAHNRVEFYYEIVDWQPFDYFTIRQKDSMTGLEYVETYHMIPTEDETHFMSCVARPEGDVTAEMQAQIQGIWNQAYAGLKAFIEGDIASGRSGPHFSD